MPREPDVGHMPPGHLERARRDLAASLALSRPGTLSAMTAHHLGAAEAELARHQRQGATGVLLCSCGYGTDNPIRFDAHLAGNPDHEPYDQP